MFKREQFAFLTHLVALNYKQITQNRMSHKLGRNN